MNVAAIVALAVVLSLAVVTFLLLVGHFLRERRELHWLASMEAATPRHSAVVSHVDEDGAAHGTLQVGDVIHAINGTFVEPSEVAATLDTLRSGEVKLALAREGFVTEVTLTKQELAGGGVQKSGVTCEPIPLACTFISAVRPDGAAAHQLQVGDAILSVGGTAVSQPKLVESVHVMLHTATGTFSVDVARKGRFLKVGPT